jgi:hypothetical protein
MYFIVFYIFLPDTEHVANLLVELAIDHNSADNITVIVLFLKAPNLIKKDWFSIGYKATMDSASEENSAQVNEIGIQVNIFRFFSFISIMYIYFYNSFFYRNLKPPKNWKMKSICNQQF